MDAYANCETDCVQRSRLPIPIRKHIPHNVGISRNWNTYAHLCVIVVLSHINSFQYSSVFILHFCFFHSLQTMRMNYLKIHRNHSLQTAINFQTTSMATRIISMANGTKVKRTRKMKEMQMPTKKLKKQQLAIASSQVSTSPLLQPSIKYLAFV